MNKMYGPKSCFIPIREDATTVIVSYDYEEQPDGINATWYELYFPKKRSIPDFEKIKDAIIADINERTDNEILNGYQWTVLHGDDAGKTVNVWLTQENQNNYKAEHDAAIMYPQLVTFPISYKISEDEDKRAIYDVFQDINELAQFYLGGVSFIKQVLAEGWQKKDNFDFTPYEQALNPSEP